MILSLSTATVYKLIETGALPHVRVSNSSRVHLSDLKLLMATNTEA